ncbi:zinc-ribbon domain-containing protein [Chloroflexus sp.]|uniref:zinc-ribbon domain-containing protein n=1 Tax=Chloroflexus sp. TaxID=1904827 RepID=UPI00298F3A45|nr:zinc-ribbon domain-containing protein [Chloroflexus sp.]MDW8404399.1 zinc ribbon domain-containing protein [Chloroflexus sp.]
MPFCPQCGVSNPDSARFCDQCGAQLIPVPARAPTPAPSAKPAATTLSGPVSAGATSCPQCGSGVIPGEAFCDNCGAPLFHAPPVAAAPAPDLPFPGAPPQPVYPPPQPATIQPVAAPASPPTPPPVASPVPPPSPARSSLAGVRLRLADGTVLPLPAAAQALIGRADPVSNFYPDIDLTPHGGLERGVGRRHGRFFVQQGQVYYEDLDSTNGSFIGGRKLPPRQPQPVRPGEELRLGTLSLIVELQ